MASSMERPPDTRSDAIFEAVGFAAERLLRTHVWREAADDVLARLGNATHASRVYIFRNGQAADGRLTTSQLHEWCAPGIVSELANPVMQDQLWKEEGLGRWVEVLGSGLPVQGHVRDLAPDEKILPPRRNRPLKSRAALQQPGFSNLLPYTSNKRIGRPQWKRLPKPSL